MGTWGTSVLHPRRDGRVVAGAGEGTDTGASRPQGHPRYTRDNLTHSAPIRIQNQIGNAV